MTQSFYEVYFTVYHKEANGREWRGEYVDTQTATSAEEAITQTKKKAHAYKQHPDERVANFQAQNMD